MKRTQTAIPNRLFSFIYYFIKKYPWSMGGLIFFAIISGCYGNLNAFITKIIIDRVANSGEMVRELFSLILFPAIFLIINHEMQNLAWRGINFIKIKVGPELIKNIIQEMFMYAHLHSYRYFQDNFSGSIANNINKMSENVLIIALELLPFFVRGFVQLMLALVTMYFVHPAFSFALLVWVVLFFSVSIYFSTRVKELSDALAGSHSKLLGQLIDSISNANSVRLFAREDYELSYLNTSLVQLSNNFRRKEWFSLWLWLAQGFSISVLIGVMIFTLIHLRTEHLVTIGDFAFILGLSMYVAENVWYLTEQVDRLNDSLGKCQQSLKMIIVPHEIIDKPDAKKLQLSQGKIEFDDVHFYYKKNSKLFENKSVIIPGGQKVGLVGYSGSGKTTFVNLIVRLFDLSSGAIKIDRQDISQVTQQSLRESIGFIPQDPILFHRSLMENIRYGNILSTDEQVMAAAKKAHAHEFITLTSHGYETLVGERGIKLSGGQRQRISIARAILKNAPILILDEATSALDSINESYIQESLTELMQHKTVIVIAHRLSTLLSMDRILVFDQGHIVEEGRHEDLINEKGLYALLWERQVGGFLLDESSEGEEMDGDEE